MTLGLFDPFDSLAEGQSYRHGPATDSTVRLPLPSITVPLSRITLSPAASPTRRVALPPFLTVKPVPVVMEIVGHGGIGRQGLMGNAGVAARF